MTMFHKSLRWGLAAAAALMVTLTAIAGGAQAADESKYPNWKGQWRTINFRLGGQVIKYDPDKA
jgi:hypothetical protein